MLTKQVKQYQPPRASCMKLQLQKIKLKKHLLLKPLTQQQRKKLKSKRKLKKQRELKRRLTKKQQQQ